MKISCLQENLAKGLSVISRAVAARSTLPVLGNVLLATDNGRLRLSATNLELSITCWVGAKIEDEGAITVPAKIFVDLVNTLPSGQVDLTLVVRTQTLNVVCGRVHANVKGIDAQEFPLVPTAELTQALRLNAADLREMIDQVVFAAAVDDVRPLLTGVLARIEGGEVTMAAADGFRLSVRTAALTEPAPQPLSIIIPARALAELGRVITADEPVYMVVPPNRGQVIFHHGSVELVAQLIEGNFPEYANIIPKSYVTRTVVSTADFRKACKTSDIFAREAAHTARLRIKPGNELEPGRVVILAAAAETGDNVAELDAMIDGQPIEVAFNVKYLVDVLNVIDTPSVALETSTPASPGVVRPVGRDDFLHLIMPMHIGK